MGSIGIFIKMGLCAYMSHPNNYMDIKTLTERAKVKDSHALDTLYRMYFPKMLGLCIKITKEDEDTAKDLVHDAFVLAFSSLHSLNAPERFGEWLSTIVRNVALKYLERKGKIHFVPINEEYEKIADIEASSDSAVNQHDILHLIEQLPNGYGKVFRLFIIEGFSHKEIADILGIETHSSSSQLSRAKAMLRKIVTRKFMATFLLLIMTIPLYLFVFHEKSSQTKLPEISEDNRRKNKDISRESKNVQERESIQKPSKENPVTSNFTDEISDTIQTSGVIDVELPIPEKIIAENKQNSIENTEMNKTSDSIPPSLMQFDCDFAINNTKKNCRKWQMLATGSLGPTMVQNMYKLFATSKIDDIGSAFPTYPEKVNTWEDYSIYLHAIAHDKMPKDTLALMEIAAHNQGEIVEQEKHEHPITFGISLSKPLSEKWSIETGLQYSILKSKSTMGNNDYYIGKDQKIHYLGIPFRLSYSFAEYKRLSAYNSVGLSLNIPIYGKVSGKYVVATMPTYTDSWHITPPIQWSANISLGMQYHLLPKMMLYAEPTLYWHIPNNSSTHTIWTEHPIMFSVPFGIRIVW